MSVDRGWQVDVHVLGLRLAFRLQPWRGLPRLSRRQGALAAR
jgi:hypothetical protein